MMRQLEKWYLPLALVLVAFLVWPGAWLGYTQGKWIGVHFAALVALALAVWRGPRLPKLKMREAVLAALVFAGSLLQLFWFSPRGFEFSLMDRLSFLILVFASWAAFRSKVLSWKDFWWPLATAITVVCIIGLWQMWKIGFPGSMPYLEVGATFGHSNHTAQFLGLALLLWWALPRPRVASWVVPAISAFALTYFFFLRGRSTLIGFSIGLLAFAYLRGLISGRKLIRNRPVLAVAGLVILLVVGLQLVKGKSIAEVFHLQILAEKSSMLTWREDVWRQTVRMIIAKPLGVGPDRFIFQFIPFHAKGTTNRETGLADTPHNEILRYLAEDGVVLAPLYFLLFLYIFLRWLKKREDLELLVPAFLFLAVEAVFQFPFYLPFPSLVLALMIGFMVSRLWPEQSPVSRPALVKGVAGVFLVFCLFISVKVVIARTYETQPDYDAASLSCRMVPLNWHSCLTKARLEIERHDLQRARETTEEIFYNDPGNFNAIRYLSLIAFQQGDRLEGCFYLWKYDDLFYGTSALHDKIAPNCQKKWMNYFRIRRPEFFMPRYGAYQARKKTGISFWE